MNHLFKNLFGDELNVGHLTVVMTFWSFFYLGLSWYIERIFPGDFGVKLPLHFPFMKSYWFDSNTETDDTDSDSNEDNPAFEKEPSDLTVSVRLKKLTKVFNIF